MSRRVLFAGCGDLGTRVGQRLVARGDEVIGLRRDPSALPETFTPLAMDLAHTGDLRLPEVDTLVITLTADVRTTAGYERTYAQGLEGLLGALTSMPRHTILVSSTRVLGTDPDRILTEDSPPVPESGPAEVLAGVEQRAAQSFADLTILRPGGIYGRGRPRLLGQVSRGVALNHRQWTNRIHYRDLVRGLEKLVTAGEQPTVLNAVDNECVQLGEVATFAAGLLGVPVPPDTGEAPAGKRIDGTRFAEFRGELEFPTFREGYAALAAREG